MGIEAFGFVADSEVLEVLPVAVGVDGAEG